MEAASEGDPADSEGCSSKGSQKRSKGRSKVWERVAWFTRRSRSREGSGELTVADIDSAAADAMEYDLSPSPSQSDSSPAASQLYLECSSSSESEIFEDFQDGYRIKRSRLYPNSEIIEQHCLKPSVARALFLQIESTNLRSAKGHKYKWQSKKKKAHNYNLGRSDSFHGACDMSELGGDVLARAVSVPNEISKSACHCPACCTCTPAQRLMGMCPAHARLSTSTASLDRGLSLTTDSNPCAKPSANKLMEPTTPATSSVEYSPPACPAVDETCSELIQFKSNSLPMSYGKRCRQCQKPTYRSHLPQRDAYFSNMPMIANICQCILKPSGCTKTGDDKLSSIPGSVRSSVIEPSTDELKSDICGSSDVTVSAAGGSDESSPYIPTTVVEAACQEQTSLTTLTEFRKRRELVRQWFVDFTDEQRNLVLRDMLEESELPQLHLLSLQMEPRLHEGCPDNCQDMLTWLPQSISLYILSFLDPVSLCRSSAVCSSWASLASDPGLWRRFCSQPKWRLSRAGEQKQLLQHMMPNGNIQWTRVFAERYRLRNNWLRGKCYVRTFEGHTQGISCVQFDDTRIVSGSSDKTIKVWNIRTNSPWLVQTLVGHSGTVRCLHLQGNRLVSGSTDKTIKVWDLSTQQSWSSIACKVTMVGHLDTVRCLQVDDEKVISGSYDRTLKVWDIRRGQCHMTLRGHEAAVLCVQFDHSKIVSGSCDKTIKVWSFSGECLMTLHGHHDAVTCLQFDETRIISGSLDCNLKFWDIHTGHCLNTIDWKASEGHTGVVRCLQADSWRVVSASDDRTLKVWNLETGERLVTLRNHTDGVTCLQFNDSIIVSGSYDKTVKLWDFSCC